MGTFQIEGGHRLKGEIQPQGAKNEALQILCAVLLTPDEVIIENIPDIIDVNKLIFILGELGVKIEKLSANSYAFQADEINLKYLESAKFKKPVYPDSDLILEAELLKKSSILWKFSCIAKVGSVVCTQCTITATIAKE